ncbi:hypothetical protein T05_11963 [Trichinella murrelli]|uniref:Uncharacterized protein n=1 Tax=Trichinella murrelli TaxID=144512 RepID=A0A0V0SZR9_9BILA|nr:hypothetical protein T05_11963 [Trichinella murrelli]
MEHNSIGTSRQNFCRTSTPLLFSLFCALSNKLLTSRNGLKPFGADERYTTIVV